MLLGDRRGKIASMKSAIGKGMIKFPHIEKWDGASLQVITDMFGARVWWSTRERSGHVWMTVGSPCRTIGHIQ